MGKSLRWRIGWLGILALLLLGGGEVWAGSRAPIEPPFRAEVVHVFDGDTVEVLKNGVSVRIRLEGIDCPERAQAFSRKATELTTRLAGGKTVTVRVLDVDRYGRKVARIVSGGRDVSLELLRAGLAWHYARFNQEDALARLEAEARAARRGLWSDPDPVAPWDWRRGNR